MKRVELKKIEAVYRIGQQPAYREPNIKESCYFVENGETIGCYLRNIGETYPKALKLLNIADGEFRSSRVPKSVMTRRNLKDSSKDVMQLSTTLGAIAPKAHMRRPYPQMSSVHQNRKARRFIKAMLDLVREGEKIYAEMLPDQYREQKRFFDEKVIEMWKFGSLFTSSISNYNIAAPYHIDRANISHTCNLIFNKKHRANGGDLYLPEYDACIESANDSLIIYPAWRNVHGVTEIRPRLADGYRNSFIFYPLKAFVRKDASG